MKVLLKYLILITIVCCSASTFAATNADEKYMQLAVELAKQNPHHPFAAIIVDNKTGKMLAQGVNDAAKTHNPTHHGEIVAINNCVQAHPNVDWSQTTLYTTGEPCAMCQGAIIWAGIAKVVYGTSVDNLKHLGWNQIDISSETLNRKANFYHGSIIKDVLADNTDALFAKSPLKSAA